MCIMQTQMTNAVIKKRIIKYDFMKNLKTISLLTFLSFVSISVNAQLLTASGQIGYAKAQGSAFKDEATGEKLSSFGFGYDADVLLCLDKFNNKLSVGVTYVGSALFGLESSSGFDIGMYGLALYGAKGHYRLRKPEKKVSPYGAFALGLSQFSTPDVYSGETLIAEGKSSFSLGLRPEIGFDLGGFLISAAYFVPMHYSIKSDTGDFSGTAGTFSISIGYRRYISLNGSSALTNKKKTNDDNAVSDEANVPESKVSTKKVDSDEENATTNEVNTSESKASAKKVKNNDDNAATDEVKASKSKVSTKKVDSNDDNVATEKAASSTKSPKDVAQKDVSKDVTVQVKTVSSQREPQNNAERVIDPKNPNENRVLYENPNFKVGEKVLYKLRDKIYTATIVSFIGSNIAVVKMENGAEVKRYLKDIVKANQ